MGSDFLGSINKSISDNMRFVKDYQANPGKYASSSGSSSSSQSSSGSGNTDMSQMLNPIIMLMMFQMMMKMMTQLGVGLPQGYAPVNTLPAAGTGGTQDATGTGAITQNPAVQYFDNRFQALATANPDATEIPWGDDEITALQEEIADKKLTPTQVGQALMYELDKTPKQNLPAVGKTIASLMESNDLNIVPFLQNDYLNQLDTDSQETLFNAVELSGLRMADGQPNARFVAFLLDNLSKGNPNKASQPETQAFIQQFMQDFYDVHGQDTTTPVGSVLAQIISLSGITADADKKLVFPA